MSRITKILNNGNVLDINDNRMPVFQSTDSSKPLVVGADGNITVDKKYIVNTWNGQSGNVIYNPPVSSVNGRTGAVVVDETNYGISITESVPAGLLKRYTFTQCGNIVGTVDLAKDLVVTSGEVVTDPPGQAPGKYIKLVIANQAAPLYINVNDLVKVYTPEPEAVCVQLQISDSNVISAYIVNGSLSFAKLNTALQNRIVALEDGVLALQSNMAPLASPDFTGVPTAPTALSITDTDQIATTAFVHSITDNLTTDVWHASTTAPTDTKLLWIDTHTDGTGGLKYYNGSTWVSVPVQYT